MNNGIKDITYRYGTIQLLFWVGYAMLGPYAGAYILDKGFSNSVLGIILCASCLVAAILQPYVGGLIDNSLTLTNRKVLTGSAIFVTLVCVLMVVMDKGSAVVCVLLMAAVYIMLVLLQPFCNALAMDYTNAGYGLRFGVSRSMGSLGFAIIAYIMGSMVEKKGVIAAPAGGVTGFGLMALALIFAVPGVDKITHITLKGQDDKSLKVGDGEVDEALSISEGVGSNEELTDSDFVNKPEIDKKGNKLSDKPGRGLSPAGFVKKYPLFSVFLLGMICVYFTHCVINVYTLQIVMEKGGGPADVGAAVGIAAASELIPMLLFTRLQKKFGYSFLIKVAVVCFNLKILLSLLVNTMPAFYCLQVLQAGGWGLMCITIVYYVNEVIDRENASQGQAFAGMSYTVGNVLTTIICGVLFDLVGVNMTVLSGFFIGVVGMAIVFMCIGRMKHSGRAK